MAEWHSLKSFAFLTFATARSPPTLGLHLLRAGVKIQTLGFHSFSSLASAVLLPMRQPGLILDYLGTTLIGPTGV